MKPHNSILAQIKLLLFILIGIGGILFLVSQTRLPQEIRNWASTLSGVEFTLQSSSTTINAGDTFEVPIFINTGTKFISSFKLVGEITGIDITKTTIEAILNTQLNSILTETYEKDGKLYFQTTQLSSPTNIFSSQNEAKKIALLRFFPDTAQTITITLVATESQAVEYGKGVLSIDVPTPQTYTISFTQPQSTTTPTPDTKKSCNENCATDTECKSEYICYQGRCRTSTKVEDDRCGSQADMGIHRGCNEYCADSQECGDDYICYYNRCRIPQNLTSESCQKPASPSPTPRPTYTTRSISYASPTPSPLTVYSPIPSPLPTPEVSVAPSLSPSPYSSPFVSTSGKTTPTPTSTKPSITPLPDNLKPENYNQKQPTSWSKVILTIIGGVGLLGILALGYFFWRNR